MNIEALKILVDVAETMIPARVCRPWSRFRMPSKP